ncbi:unnamed protein product [Calypogeia fissa]
MSAFRYRARARKGLWKVEAVFYPNKTQPLGYVCHHVDVNGPDLLRRAAIVGVSYQNDHADRDVVYVNRYDWSRIGCPNSGSEFMYKLLKMKHDFYDEIEDEDESMKRKVVKMRISSSRRKSGKKIGKK